MFANIFIFKQYCIASVIKHNKLFVHHNVLFVTMNSLKK